MARWQLSPAPVRGDVGSHLTTLVRKELIRSTAPTFPEDEGYRFRHLLIRDAAYESLPKATRAELHEQFADWLSTHDLVEGDEIVGYHLEQAHRYRAELDPERRDLAELGRLACGHLAEAGRGALDRGDYTAALSLLRRGVRSAPPGDREAMRSLLTSSSRSGSPATSTRPESVAVRGDAHLRTRGRLAPSPECFGTWHDLVTARHVRGSAHPRARAGTRRRRGSGATTRRSASTGGASQARRGCAPDDGGGARRGGGGAVLRASGRFGQTEDLLADPRRLRLRANAGGRGDGAWSDAGGDGGRLALLHGGCGGGLARLLAMEGDIERARALQVARRDVRSGRHDGHRRER